MARTLSAHFCWTLTHIISISKWTTVGGDPLSMAFRWMICTWGLLMPRAVAKVDHSGPSCMATSLRTCSVMGSLVGMYWRGTLCNGFAISCRGSYPHVNMHGSRVNWFKQCVYHHLNIDSMNSRLSRASKLFYSLLNADIKNLFLFYSNKSSMPLRSRRNIHVASMFRVTLRSYSTAPCAAIARAPTDTTTRR